MDDSDDVPSGQPAAGPDLKPPDEDDDVRGLVLHRRLMERDPVAVQDVWLRFYQTLVSHAERRIFDEVMREDLAGTFAMKCVVALIDHPERFDPTRGKSLGGYLRMDLDGDLKNYFAQVERRPKIIRSSQLGTSGDDDVGNDDPIGNIPSDEPTPDEVYLTGESAERVAEIRRAVVHTTEEDIVFRLQYIDAERSNDVFASALGIAHRPVKEQTAQVQQVKDRIAKRLRRLERNFDDRGRER